MGTGSRCKPVQRCSAMSDMKMDVDQPRSDVETGNIYYFVRVRRGDILLYRCYLALRYRNVHHSVNPVCRIDDVPTLEHKIVARWLALGDAVGRESEQQREGLEG